MGCMELLTAFILLLGAFKPILSALGGLMSAITFLITLTFMLTTPGVIEPSAGGFPALSGAQGNSY